LSDDYQIEIPQSFIALFLAPGGNKPSVPRAELAQRYELCEDMANLLAPTAQEMLHGLGITEADVLQRCYQGLCTEPAVVSISEAGWVICRLAELSGWPLPISLLAP
jgi:hypothetical protein